ncbi:hypothetical protein DRQ25_18080 [Candidatus Fermentibacteria bacterium]|nr:MAG: hypothetical protein DRQ25_18080 [Candidatus Fermentibacteria bacterium]
MNYLELARAVRAQAGISGEGPSNVSETVGIYGDVLRWVRESYNEIQTEYENWNFLHVNYSLQLPKAFKQLSMPAEGVRTIAKETFIYQAISGERGRIIYVPYSVWKIEDKFILNVAEEGLPSYVTILPNSDLVMDATAPDDMHIQFEGYREPHVMGTSTDVPIFPVQYHALIQFKALMKYGAFYNAQEIYKANEIAYKELLSKMKYSELPKDNLITPTLVPFA